RDRPPSGKSEGGCLLRGTSSIAGEPAAPLLPPHAAEFLFDHGGDGGLDLRMAEAVDDLTTETEGEQLTSDILVDSAGAQVMNLLGLKRTAGRAMAAFYLVRVDLESRQGVGFRLVTE